MSEGKLIDCESYNRGHIDGYNEGYMDGFKAAKELAVSVIDKHIAEIKAYVEKDDAALHV